MARQHVITLRIERDKLVQTATVLPVLLVLLAIVTWAVSDMVARNTQTAPPPAAAEPTAVSVPTGYPASGATLDRTTFARSLPPPPLDAVPYDVREPLSNGVAVPVKKRWLWLPEGAAIRLTTGAVDVPVGAVWWKEFYVETDRGAFLIERRIIERVAVSAQHPQGWAYYSSHAAPPDETGSITLDSTSDEASRFMFASTDWLPTQDAAGTFEVRFRDARGVTYPYVFPGQTQCTVCHAGAAGAYPNAASDPIQVFGLHPNNLTVDSFTALVARGWLVGAEALLSAQELPAAAVPLDEATQGLVAIMRNNCASCHNAASGAAASYTAFVIDPNRAYSSDELRELLSVSGRMMGDASHPLVTPGSLEESEVWLRINGLDGRRRMPPLEGGLPEPDPDIIAAWRAWILAAGG